MESDEVVRMAFGIVMIGWLLAGSGPVVPAEMVLIPAGAFVMGSDEVDREGRAIEVGSRKPWYLDEHPRRVVRLPAYLIDRYEVATERGRLPLTDVTWAEADAYCRRLSKRLPTEAEWEKAARGPAGLAYVWGETYQPANGNTGGAGVGGPRPVGSFPGDRSPYGVYDLAGNVMEWTASWYQAYPGSDHQSPDFGERFRVVRGDSYGGPGGHYYLAHFTRAAYRLNVSPNSREPFIGFRCARSYP